MALNLTRNTLRALNELSIEPNIVVQFEGYPVVFSQKRLKEYITIGCPGFFIGEPGYFVGGLKDIDEDRNKTLIDDKTTSFNIVQQMNHDEGESSSISTMTVGLVDKDKIISRLISPGQDLEEILGRKVTISITYGEVSFFEDSIVVFKGFVTAVDSLPGLIKFKINHPDNKKNVKLFKTAETRLTGALNATQTTIGIDDGSTFFQPQGPLNTYAKIGDEIIQYTTATGSSLSGITRGVLGTTATPHASGDQVRSIYSLEGNPLDLAMQLMMSGFGTDPSSSEVEVSSFLQIGSGITQIPNAIYFNQVRIGELTGVRPGDTVSIIGASNASNNVVQALVTEVVTNDLGSYVVLSGTSLVLEEPTSATMSVFSQFNTLPDGMKMSPDEVDIDEHIKIRDFFHSSVQMRLFIKESDIDGKEFIEKELYRPIACYALPRKAAASVGYTVGPIPGEDIKTLDITNIREPDKLRITRTTSRAFFNEVFYKYDDDPGSQEPVFTKGELVINQDSKNRIPGAARTFIIESLGLRSDLNGEVIATSNAARIIDRYKFAAETLHGKMLLRVGAGIEIGDIIVADLEALQTTDITRGDRRFKPRLFEIQNKSLSLKTGDVTFAALDTGLNIDTRFGLMSPCSRIASQISPSQIVIGPDANYPSRFGDDVYRDWEPAINSGNPMAVIVRSPDYTIIEELVVTSVSENTFTFRDPATINILPGYIIEFAPYTSVDTSAKQTLVYAYMTDDAAFPDGEPPYSMI